MHEAEQCPCQKLLRIGQTVLGRHEEHSWHHALPCLQDRLTPHKLSPILPETIHAEQWLCSLRQAGQNLPVAVVEIFPSRNRNSAEVVEISATGSGEMREAQMLTESQFRASITKEE